MEELTATPVLRPLARRWLLETAAAVNDGGLADALTAMDRLRDGLGAGALDDLDGVRAAIEAIDPVHALGRTLRAGLLRPRDPEGSAVLRDLGEEDVRALLAGGEPPVIHPGLRAGVAGVVAQARALAGRRDELLARARTPGRTSPTTRTSSATRSPAWPAGRARSTRRQAGRSRRPPRSCPATSTPRRPGPGCPAVSTTGPTSSAASAG
ncbi:hypothetical protein OIE66_20415 [Nonomuraea sp. NBC_01738]|uniref:hypothetical protein n=1 Tax=Nonomuraea sp. NBC_01738 TaxID=2976003 RepID=UPI002E1396F8|nr:hypothetical protein OIE66_20415 [Nonomuraea sp. NBC_01738]